MTNLALGLMSGTSADGLTICLFDAGAKKVIHFKNYPYTEKLQNKILGAAGFKTPQLAELNFELGKIYAQLMTKFFKEFKINPAKIAVIGSHGQTVWHAPLAQTPNTLQIGEAAFLAQAFNIPVVHNFRAADIAAGGSGAPLMPAFDDFLFANAKPAMLLNIGGISNVSACGRGIKTYGFDIGPGNVMIDEAVRILTKNRIAFDKAGALAAKHTPDIKKAKSLLPLFVAKKPPVSLDRNSYTKPFINKYFPAVKEQDISTITYLTALIISESLKKFILRKHKIKVLRVSGGGVFNKTLLKYLQANLPGIEITVSDFMDPMAKEAAAFGWFALQTLRQKSANCPAATGAKKKVILGSVILPCK